MAHPFYSNRDNEYSDLDSTLPTYFGFKKGCFDMQTMKYRVFGAVWKLLDGKKYILRYWFADQENEILFAVKDAGFTSPISSQVDDINDIYQVVRMKQDIENWSKKSKLKFYLILKKPWKDLRKGWYVLKSSTNFPCVLTCIQKKRYSIWIEHIQVCEDKNDAVKFINLINTEHNIHLNSEGFAEIDYKKINHTKGKSHKPSSNA